jgi:hypothetical protein
MKVLLMPSGDTLGNQDTKAPLSTREWQAMRVSITVIQTANPFQGSHMISWTKSSDKQIADDTEKPCYVVTTCGNMKRYDPDPNKRRRGQETTIGKAKK